ncbi:stress protein [Bacillus sp. FJAT-27264]|uniref:Dabb family protein n=1 Tax=Paenibacillus sp. (strain DSM 101736 / FJAT-27264) TaxID=1850362 RepID=UPI000807DF6C|nr:Dabb family protein [Bacillus sp. FJAT-27264]OBZ19033.1 stress protein [Bacillus sp. FJAT-27264]
MITNNMMIRLKDRSPENIAKTREVLLSMRGQIETLRDLKVDVDIRHEQSSYDLMFVAKYDSMAGFDAYMVHPFHVEVSQYIGSVIDTGASVCYES